MSATATGAWNALNRFSFLAAIPGAELGNLLGTAFGGVRKVVNTVGNPILNLGRRCLGKETISTKSLSDYSRVARRRCSKALGLASATVLTAPVSPFLAAAGAAYGSQKNDLELLDLNLMTVVLKGHRNFTAMGLARVAADGFWLGTVLNELEASRLAERRQRPDFPPPSLEAEEYD